MTRPCVWHDSFVCGTSIWAQLCGCFPECVCHDSFMCVRLVRVCDMTRSCVWCVWHDSFMCVTRLVCVCDKTRCCLLLGPLNVCVMTRSCVWHDSFICVIWLVHDVSWLVHVCDTSLAHRHVDIFLHVCAMTCSCVWHDSFTCVSWLVHVCDSSHAQSHVGETLTHIVTWHRHGHRCLLRQCHF